MYEVAEKDWKLFRKRLPDWQEKYMVRLCEEYIALLSSDKNASERFWELEKRIRKDQLKTGIQADMRRSRMIENLARLVSEGAITLDDLEGFTEDTIQAVRPWARY